jgi:protein-arginine kinase
MRELFSVSVDEDDNIVIRSILPKDELKELLTSILESIDNNKAFEIEVNNDDKPKYLA